MTVVDPATRARAAARRCSVDRGIEVGHVFQLGTKYSEALDAHYTDEDGEQHPMVMGCYGIGVSRIVAAVVEEHHDEHGIVWPAALAPYDVHLVALPGRGRAAAEVAPRPSALRGAAAARASTCSTTTATCSPGVKFADADLVGMPVQLIVGAKGLARGIVERATARPASSARLPRRRRRRLAGERGRRHHRAVRGRAMGRIRAAATRPCDDPATPRRERLVPRRIVARRCSADRDDGRAPFDQSWWIGFAGLRCCSVAEARRYAAARTSCTAAATCTAHARADTVDRAACSTDVLAAVRDRRSCRYVAVVSICSATTFDASTGWSHRRDRRRSRSRCTPRAAVGI